MPPERSQTKAAEVKRTWRHVKKQDPAEAERLRAQQNEHKRRSRARKKLVQQGLQQPDGAQASVQQGLQQPDGAQAPVQQGLQQPDGEQAPVQPGLQQPDGEQAPVKRRRAVTPDSGPSHSVPGSPSGNIAAGSEEPPAKRCRTAIPDAGTSHFAPGSSSGCTPAADGPSAVPEGRIVSTGPSDPPLYPATLQVNRPAPSRLFSHISVATEPPPMTRDVEVMTELAHIDPSCSQDDPIVPSTPLTPPVYTKDLATNLIGVKVSSHSETVKWSSGFTTVLPCIWKGGLNICQEDADTVRYLSELPESDPELSLHVVHIHHSDWISKPTELRDLISQTLREGKCIVIRAARKPQAARLDLDYLEDQGFSQFMRVSIHDVEERTKDYTHPYVEGTIEDFMRNLNDPNCIQFILDLPYTGRGIPDHLRQLDHGIAHGWNQTTTDYPIQDKVHPDNFLLNGWSLLHQPGVLTNFHHDSDGGVTFVQSVLGKKQWIPAFPRNPNISRTKFIELSLLLTNLLANRTEIEENWSMEVVTLEEGDLFIQPPGQYHAVYTPTDCFAKGAHCLNLEFLHHSELSRFVDAKKGHFLTNQVHQHSLETLERMVIYLPRASQRTRLFIRPLIALCTMVIESHKYLAVGADKKKTPRNTTKPALAISRAIIKHFWKDLETATSVYRFGANKRSGSQSLTHPGDLIDREQLAICLKPFTEF
ncbi:hypothetical protein EV702DRAFT_1201889 [Suillus placidus]|uniref:JmjC domain-containing protein n=1 Tax=Suillus placidus TaxID=48579 RepID=A0A9P6ZLT3_9AGAM|nr:hypothetical protein EV702DRAFT_1201889 [Suillus placidus]